MPKPNPFYHTMDGSSRLLTQPERFLVSRDLPLIELDPKANPTALSAPDFSRQDDSALLTFCFLETAVN